MAKVIFSQILEYMYSECCITLAKERKEKKEKGNSRVSFLHYHKRMSFV